MAIGYPYYYGEEVSQDRNTCLGFYLAPVPDELTNLERVAYASSVVITNSPPNFNFGDEFVYRFCDEISQVCGTFTSIPETGTLVLDYNGFCQMISESENILLRLSKDLGITKESVVEQAANFFSQKNVIVQPTGVQGVIYKVGSYVQVVGSASFVSTAIQMGKVAGVSGFQALNAQPALVVAVPTMGALFFYGCALVTGNSTIGRVCTTAGDICALPMKGVELAWNRYANPISQQLFGIPMILNMTQTYKTGSGYTLKEMAAHIHFNRTSVLKKVKKAIIRLLGE